LTGLLAARRTACMTGAWAARIRPDAGQALTLSPGDLDEAVAEMLAKDSLIATDASGKIIPSGFARVDAFRTGFTSGIGACAAMTA
jgi:predicted metalloprotease